MINITKHKVFYSILWNSFLMFINNLVILLKQCIFKDTCSMRLVLENTYYMRNTTEYIIVTNIFLLHVNMSGYRITEGMKSYVVDDSLFLRTFPLRECHILETCSVIHL